MQISKKISIEDISLLIPIALFSFNGIAINSVPELGYDPPKILLILRYEIWLIISLIINSKRIIESKSNKEVNSDRDAKIKDFGDKFNIN